MRDVLDDVLRVGASQHRVEEPAVRQPVDASHRVVDPVAVMHPRDRIEVEGDADLRVRHALAQLLDGQPVTEHEVVRRREGVRAIRTPRSVPTAAVAEEGRAPRLVEGDEVLDPVAEGVGDVPGILRKPVCRVARRPAARVLERLREVPVVEGRPRRDATVEERVDQPAVEVHPGLVHRSGAGRLHAWPGDREAVGVDAEVGHQVDVLLVAMEVLDRDVAVVPVDHATGSGREGVPDGAAPAALGGGALDLVARRGDAPGEVVGKVAARQAVVDRHGHPLTPPCMMPPMIWRPNTMNTMTSGRVPRRVPAMTSAWSV